MARYGFEREKPERLAGIEATWDPGTRALLESLGLRRGLRCLEVGAGGGSVAAWMAERVGPDGYVLATDLDVTHVEPLASDVLEVRRHDLMADPLPEASFDLAHARSVVSWLGSGDAVDRLVRSLRPGGRLLLEDFDWALGGALADTPATAKAYDAILTVIESVGYDRHFGRTLLTRLEQAGLEDTDSEGRCYVLRGGSLGTAFDRFSLAGQRERLIGGGVSEADYEATQRYLADPANLVLTPVLYAAWGRKPGA
jgi:SAM-dependent methyltransferase